MVPLRPRCRTTAPRVRIVGTPRRGVVHLVVPAPDGRRVLARPNGLAGWALPTIAADLPLFQWTDAEVTRASRTLGAAVVPVRRIGAGAWEVEVRGRVSAAGNTWIGLDEVDRLGVDAAPARSVLGEDRPGRGHLRPGWIADLETWIDGHFGRTGPLTIRCHWELSAVVSFPTADGEVVVKQNGPGFTREAAVLAALADVAHVPPVLATEDDRFALPWAGVEGVDRPTIAAALGRLHRGAEDRVERLRAAGCPTTDDLVRSLGRTDLEAPPRRRPPARSRPSVVHADAHPGNVLVHGGDVTVIDWTDAVVGDPVLDLPMVLLPEAARARRRGPCRDERAVVEAWASARWQRPGPAAGRLRLGDGRGLRGHRGALRPSTSMTCRPAPGRGGRTGRTAGAAASTPPSPPSDSPPITGAPVRFPPDDTTTATSARRTRLRRGSALARRSSVVLRHARPPGHGPRPVVRARPRPSSRSRPGRRDSDGARTGPCSSCP